MPHSCVLGGGCALSPPTDVFPTIPTSSVARNPPTPLPRVRGPGRKGLALLHLRRYAEAAEAYRKGLALAHPPAPPMPSQRALFFLYQWASNQFPEDAFFMFCFHAPFRCVCGKRPVIQPECLIIPRHAFKYGARHWFLNLGMSEGKERPRHTARGFLFQGDSPPAPFVPKNHPSAHCRGV